MKVKNAKLGNIFFNKLRDRDDPTFNIQKFQNQILWRKISFKFD